MNHPNKSGVRQLVEPSNELRKSSSAGIEGLEKQSLSTKADVPPRNIEGWKWIAVVFSILSSTFLFALDNTITANIQPRIIEDFGEIDKLAWIGVALVMSATATILLWGKIFDQFNSKWTYIVSVALFEIGSAVCGAAPNMNALIIGRVICGIGGSGLYVGVMTLLAALTTIQERPMYVASTGFTWGLGMVLGPIVGGAFTDSSAGWRWGFYINLCVGAVCAPVFLFIIPNVDPRPGTSFKSRCKEMDYVGSCLTVGAFVSGIMAISFGGVTYRWNSATIIGLFLCSGLLFVLLGLQQAFAVFTTITRRLFPVQFLRSRTMLILFAITACSATAVFVPIYMVPILFQFTRGDSALDAGVRLLPFIIFCVVAIIINGGVLSAYGVYMPWYLCGSIFVLIGGALMYTVDEHTSVAKIYGYTIMTGFGAGLFLQASFSVAQASVPVDMIASAVGFITCAQVMGTTIALALANSLFLNKSQTLISNILPGRSLEEIQGAITGSTSAFVTSLSAAQKAQVLTAIVTSMSKTYSLVITAGAFGILLSLGMKRERLFLQPVAA